MAPSSPSPSSTKNRPSTPKVGGGAPGGEPSSSSSSSSNSNNHSFFDWPALPLEMQVRALSYLRAVDLSAVHQTSRYFWQNGALQHAIVVYCSEQVYPANLTRGFAAQPTTTTSTGTTNHPATTAEAAAETAVTTTKGKGKKTVVGRKNRSSSMGSVEEACATSSSSSPRAGKNRSASMGSLLEDEDADDAAGETAAATATTPPPPLRYTFEHLRNMELLVVARVLNSPEPATGYVVSKSWCKTALRWLEGQQERIMQQHSRRSRPQAQQQQQQQDHHHSSTTTTAPGSSGSSYHKKHKKKTKKQRLKERKQSSHSSNRASSSSSAPPPAANINLDITCEHDQLQHYTSTRSARARRRLLDKQAWKILKALYPESTPLPAVAGECLQCRAEACQAEKQRHDARELARAERKRPLKDASVRRFYTRTRGVPEHCLLKNNQTTTTTMSSLAAMSESEFCSPVTDGESTTHQKVQADDEEEEDRKMPARITPSSPSAVAAKTETACTDCPTLCPFVDGTYYVLPRSWCHGWRRFMKTGEGGMTPTKYAPPDAACLLCDAHRMALLPPHLEAFLSGESSHLLEAAGSQVAAAVTAGSSDGAPVPSLPPGQAPTEAIHTMRALGLTEAEISLQLTAMRSIEAQRQRIQRQASINNNGAEGADGETGGVSRNELLDRENHSVVEILTQDEFRALEACWPGLTLFALRFTVRHGRKWKRGDAAAAVADDDDDDSYVHRGVHFCTPVCQSCDATGRQCSVSIKNRRKRWNKKSSEKARAPASLEY